MRAYYAHLCGMVIKLQYFPTLDSLQQMLHIYCSTECPNTPQCDIDGVVGEIIPLVHIARVVFLIIGIALMLTPFWNRG